jgi:Holliday junction resolvase RusA-like endonuclease
VIQFTIQGPPKGKERPKVSTKSGKPRAYTPRKTAEYERLVRTSYALQVGERDPFPEDVPLSAVIRVGYRIPKSDTKKTKERKRSGEILPTKKGSMNPDLDNVAKAILDALNGVAYVDDSQVVFLGISKHYMDDPCTYVIIDEYKK